MALIRVLIVDHAVELGGAERVLLRLLDRIDRERFSPALACPQEGPLTGEAERRGIPVFLGHPSRRLLKIKRQSLGSDRLSILGYPLDLALSAIRLARLIREEGFDLVFTNSAKADIYGSLAGWLARRPVVWRLHDIVDRQAFSWFNVWLFRACARFLASRILAISEAVRKTLVALGVPEEKVPVVYHGIDLDEEDGENLRREVREELGIDSHAPVVGFVGRLVDWKGPDCFIRAASWVAERLPEARFVVVGEAILGERSYEESLKGLCNELGLGERLIFTGFREDIERIMAALDVLVHASLLPEPFGMVILEAMAAGRPVVATAGGGVPEIVINGVTGLLVPPGDEVAMAVAILHLLTSPERAHRMGMEGRKRVAEHFDATRAVRSLEEELLKVLGLGKKAGEGRCSCG